MHLVGGGSGLVTGQFKMYQHGTLWVSMRLRLWQSHRKAKKCLAFASFCSTSSEGEKVKSFCKVCFKARGCLDALGSGFSR